MTLCCGGLSGGGGGGGGGVLLMLLCSTLLRFSDREPTGPLLLSRSASTSLSFSSSTCGPRSEHQKSQSIFLLRISKSFVGSSPGSP